MENFGDGSGINVSCEEIAASIYPASAGALISLFHIDKGRARHNSLRRGWSTYLHPKVVAMANNSDALMENIEKKISDYLPLSSLAKGLDEDITFQAKGGTMKAHRGVLAAVSPIFQEMPCTVSLPDMDLECLQLFFVLLYTPNEETMATPEFDEAVDKHFAALFDATHRFEVEGRLNGVLKRGLPRHLTPVNCWDFYHKYQGLTAPFDHDLSEACVSYVVNNAEEVMASDVVQVEMVRNPKLVQRCLSEAFRWNGF